MNGNWKEHASKWITDRTGPVMPWLFLALRRALIPTVCCTLLLFLFFGIPQSREVLHGLIQSDFKTRTSAAGSAHPIINTMALTSYIIAAWVLSLAMWYAARLLCMVMNGLSRPVVWSQHETQWTKISVNIAEVWLPRGLGIVSLAVAMGALVYANYSRSSQISDTRVLWLVIVSLCAPLAAVGGALAYLRGKPKPKPKLALVPIVVGVVLSLVSLGIYLALSKTRPVPWASFGATWCPAIMLAGLAWRRSRIERRASAGSAAGTPKVIDLKLGDVIGRVLGFIVLGAAGLYFLATVDADIARNIGSAAAIMVFLAALVMVLTGLQLVLRWLSQCVPGLTTALVLFLVIPVAYIAKKTVGIEWVDLPHAPPVVVASAKKQEIVRTALESQTSTQVESAKKPDVYVYAFGGGIRAAIFTAQSLALADDASCGKFGERVAALSGVSGGSLGIATYLIARQVLIQQKGASLWEGCEPGKSPAKTPVLAAVTQALVQDHLSPAIARAVSIDLLPIVPPQRGKALLESWDDALSTALKETSDAKPPVTLQMELRTLTGGMHTPPTVYFNATDSTQGSIVWFSNKLKNRLDCEFGTVPNVMKVNCGNLTVGQAVLHSSRFPIVTPTGSFSIDGKSMRLVDGGYADNSGGETLRYQIDRDALKQGSLLEIDGNPLEEGMLCGGPPRETPVPTPVEALLLSRSAHASLAAQQVRDLVHDCADTASKGRNCTYRARLDLEKRFGVTRDNLKNCARVHDAQVPPLGWYTGFGASDLIKTSVAMQVPSICRQADLECRVD